MDLREQNFGIEVEMTGLTRERAAKCIADFLGSDARHIGGTYDEWHIQDSDYRIWKVVSDGSIYCQARNGMGGFIETGRAYSVEVVSPICVYDDIALIQEMIRKLRGAGAIANSSVGIHIHINARPFNAQQIRNLVNIMASKEDLIYKALQVESTREARYCRKIDRNFLRKLNKIKPRTMEKLKDIWYNGRDGSRVHYHESRYHCLNLHSIFQKGTIEFRAFNSGDGSGGRVIHAGKIKAYIQFCMAMTAQAYNQRSAKPDKTVTENDKYSFRVWLLRLGMIGDEFKTARKHLLANLTGNIAWRDPAQAEAQKERLRRKKEEMEDAENETVEEMGDTENETIAEDMESDMQEESAPALSMTM